MKKTLLILTLASLALGACHFGNPPRTNNNRKQAKAKDGKIPDTVKVGIYITSLHDIDFKQKEYNTNFWIWFKYKRKEFDFANNLEIPNAKTFSKSFTSVDTTGGRVYVLMKIQATMKDSWRIGNFPFDRQRMMLGFENSQYDINDLVFVADTSGKQFDPRFTLNGWYIDSCKLSVTTRPYESSFGLDLDSAHMDYSAFRVRMVITRDASGLFWKMFLGMYIAFLIAYVCFYIHADGFDSRFGLSVGALFAVIGNKYIVDSSLPESTSYTLVDALHGITLFFILAIISATAVSLKLVKTGRTKLADRFDFITAQVFLLIYVVTNLWLILGAINSD